jgi:dephospho-CoA kinase
MRERQLRRNTRSAKKTDGLVIGITGQIASGKSSVAAEFQRLGARVVSGDDLGREVVESDLSLRKALTKHFGLGILTKSGQINRRKLGSLAFADPQSTEILNSLVHPRLLKRLRQEITRFRRQRQTKLLVVDAALIYYWGLERELDLVIVVESKLSSQKARLEMSGLTPREITDRIRRQMPKYIQRQKADLVITNNGTAQELRRRTQRVYQRLLELQAQDLT